MNGLDKMQAEEGDHFRIREFITFQTAADRILAICIATSQPSPGSFRNM
jgi:hypothetical protein